MKKIPTLYRRDPDDIRHLLREVNPAAAWVLDGQAQATRKFDGVCHLLDREGCWWARREVKPGKAQPSGYRAVEADPETGKTVGWEPVEQSAFHRAFTAALNDPVPHVNGYRPGTYELCGPTVNRNPENYAHHVLEPHGLFYLHDVPTSYDELAAYLADLEYEGVVWHAPDGRMAKIKRRDFHR